MPQFSVRVGDDLGQQISEYADEYDESQSEAIRSLLHRGIEYDRLQQENKRLQRAQTQLLEQREENQELVRFAEEQRSLVSEQRDRQNAPVWRRAKWWVFGGQEQGRGQ